MKKLRALISLVTATTLFLSFSMVYAVESESSLTNEGIAPFSIDITIGPTDSSNSRSSSSSEVYSQEIFFTRQGVLPDGTVIMTASTTPSPRVGDNVSGFLYVQKVSNRIYSVSLDLSILTSKIRSASATVNFGDGTVENKSAAPSTLPSSYATINYTNHYYAPGEYTLWVSDYTVVVNDADNPQSGIETWLICGSYPFTAED